MQQVSDSRNALLDLGRQQRISRLVWDDRTSRVTQITTLYNRGDRNSISECIIYGHYARRKVQKTTWGTEFWAYSKCKLNQRVEDWVFLKLACLAPPTTTIPLKVTENTLVHFMFDVSNNRSSWPWICTWRGCHMITCMLCPWLCPNMLYTTVLDYQHMVLLKWPVIKWPCSDCSFPLVSGAHWIMNCLQRQCLIPRLGNKTGGQHAK